MRHFFIAVLLALGIVPCACSKKVTKEASEALAALKALRSVSGAGVNFQNYEPRVLDAKINVDHFLESADAGPLRQAVSAAIREYVLASATWNASITSNVEQLVANGNAIATDPEISKCPEVARYVQTAKAQLQDYEPRTTPMSRRDLDRCIASPRCLAAMKDEAARDTAAMNKVMEILNAGEKLGLIKSSYWAKKPETDQMRTLASIGGKEAVTPLWACAARHTAEADRLLH